MLQTPAMHRPPKPLAIAEKLYGIPDALPLSVPQLLARLAIANIFWRSGQTKLANWDLTVQLFQNEYRVPLLPADMAALLGTAFELACPILLVLGLATRLATLPLLAMTFVIQVFIYPQSWTDHLTWTALLIFLLARGPGAYSLDHGIGHLLRRLLKERT